MNNTPLSQENVDSIFSQLNADDVDQFYRGYQRWRFQQRLAALREQIDELQQRMAVNRAEMQQNAPSAMALASLARMQSRGVQDAGLLDRLLERGDEWLDQTIQRLEYCEQTGLIGDDYTKWCEHALEGAYDWIDSLTGANGAAPASQFDTAAEADREVPTTSEPLPQTTEAMLLKKLMSEEEEASTLKLPAVPATPALAEVELAEFADVPAEQIVPEEPDAHDAPEPENLAEDESSQPTSDAQQTSVEEFAPPAEQAAALAQTQPESESAVTPDAISEPDNAARANGAHEPAPSEQYVFPESLDEIIPSEAETAFPRDNPPPLAEQAAVFSAVPISNAAQPVAMPAARPPRKRNFWQKLVYVLAGK
ncbi:MAG: hypothetical protein WCD86_23335 [Ktedonobacteraceae bacterium]